MSNIIQAINNLKIYKKIEMNDNCVHAIIGENRNIEMFVSDTSYTIKYEWVTRTFNIDKNIVDAILEMQTIASQCL